MNELVTLAARAAVENAGWLGITTAALLVGGVAMYLDRRSSR